MKETKKRLVKELRFNQNINGYKRNNEPDVYEINYSYWKDFTNKFISGKKVLLDKSMTNSKDYPKDLYWHYFEDPKLNPMFDYEYSFEERNEWIMAIDGFDTIKYKNVLCYRCYDKKRQRLVFEEFYIPGPKVKNLDKTLFLVGSEVYDYLDNIDIINCINIKKFDDGNLSVNMPQKDGSVESVTIPFSKSIKYNVWEYEGYDFYKQEWKNEEKYIQIKVPELNFHEFEHSYRPKLLKRISYRAFCNDLCKTQDQRENARKLNKYTSQNYIEWYYHYQDDLLTSVSLYRGDVLVDDAYRLFTYKTIYGRKYFDSVTKKRYNFIDGVNLENTYRINHEYSPTGKLLKSQVFKIKNGDEKLFTDCILEFPYDPKIKYPTYYESNYYDSHCIGEEPKVIEALKEKYFVVLDDDGDVVGEYCYQKGRRAISEIQFINQYEIV